MSKAYFWPATLVVMGLVILASRLGMLSDEFTDLWPVIMLVVGLGGLLTADRSNWLCGGNTGKKSGKKRSK